MPLSIGWNYAYWMGKIQHRLTGYPTEDDLVFVKYFRHRPRPKVEPAMRAKDVSDMKDVIRGIGKEYLLAVEQYTKAVNSHLSALHAPCLLEIDLEAKGLEIGRLFGGTERLLKALQEAAGVPRRVGYNEVSSDVWKYIPRPMRANPKSKQKE